jgi:OOP family OmpA-OmpF porin
VALPPPAAPPAAAPAAPVDAMEKWHFSFDLYTGMLFRVGKLPEPDLARGGGLVGLDARIGRGAWFDVGVGYERAFFGRTRVDDRAGTFRETSRSWDALWITGRAYPWHTDDMGVFVLLGAGPAWQRVRLSGTEVLENPAGQVTAQPFACSASAPAGLGLRGAVGVDVWLGSFMLVSAQLGADHMRLTSDSLDNCANGGGSGTFLAGRIGLAFGTGHEKHHSDRDKDGIFDEKDACPDEVGVASEDPKKNGCPAPTDRDKDGILDDVDGCPDVAGVPNADPAKHGCPAPTDRDKDGIFDDKDACPDEAGVATDDPKTNGCPPPKDKDGDGVIDDKDACIDIPGIATQDPATNGCPGDTDGDTIRDDKDACPKDKGLPNQDPSKHGCPLVVFTEKEIVISEQVQFDLDRSTIKPESNALLDAIAAVIKAHPELQKIEVQGHTDSSGSKQHNKILSQGRADAVRKALVKRGIADKTFDSVGYGSEQPIADNATDEGRAKNRRVQFKITKKKDKDAAATDAPKAPAPAAPKAPAPAAPKAPAPAVKAPAPAAPAPKKK